MSAPDPTDSPVVGAVRFTRAERTREAILEATLALLREHGYAGTSISMVAAHAGVSKATIYKNWRSKSELIVELISRFAEHAGNVPDTGDLREDLRLSISNIIAVAGPTRGVIEGIVAEASHDKLRAGELRRLVGIWRDNERALFQRAVQRAATSLPIHEKLAVDLAAAMVWFRLSLCDAEDIDELPDQLADTILRAWGVAATAPTKHTRQQPAKH